MSDIKISGLFDEVSINFVKQLETAKKLNIKYICPRNVNGRNIATYSFAEWQNYIIPLLDKYGLRVSTIGSDIGKIPLFDDKRYFKQLDELKEIVKVCEVLKIKNIRIFSFFVDKSGNYEIYHRKVIERLKCFLEIIKNKDIRFVHENEKDIYGDEPNRCRRMCKDLDTSQFKLLFDAGNYLQSGYDYSECWEITKPFTAEFHIKDCSPEKVEMPLGKGIVNYEKILSEAFFKGFDGYLDIEPHTAKYAHFKRIFYVFPFLNIRFKNHSKVFKNIDNVMQIPHFKKVSAEEVFIWQHTELIKLLDKLNFKYE